MAKLADVMAKGVEFLKNIKKDKAGYREYLVRIDGRGQRAAV
ncbi:MAG: hypothetical protein RR671_02925 [Raoultibacter sp.]